MREKTDRRVKYTKKVLRESLVQLLQTKPLARITIKEICEGADINRGTFYTHYSDQFDLLHKIEEETVTDILAYLDGCAYQEKEAEATQMLHSILLYVKVNASLIKVLLGNNGDIDFRRSIMDIVYKHCISYWEKSQAIPRPLADYAFEFIVTGSLGILERWLQHGCVEKERALAQLIVGLANKGLGTTFA
ncbi:MAG: TetR-like C-terminal domain-containing protein [Eubacteriales bacterium]